MQKLVVGLLTLLLVPVSGGSILGRLVMLDPSEPMIIGAEVRVLLQVDQNESKEVRKTTSEDDGSFLIENLPEGRYIIVVSSNGTTVSDVCDVRDGQQCKPVFEF